jgi:hypothetical protein
MLPQQGKIGVLSRVAVTHFPNRVERRNRGNHKPTLPESRGSKSRAISQTFSQQAIVKDYGIESGKPLNSGVGTLKFCKNTGPEDEKWRDELTKQRHFCGRIKERRPSVQGRFLPEFQICPLLLIKRVLIFFL